MKNKIKFIVTSLAVIAFMSGCAGYQSVAGTQPEYQGGPSISFNDFYSSLSPYGNWINYGNYGQVWIPSTGFGFTPYSTNGHWVLSDYGWTWVSDYSWGWAPFHYGRWLYDDYYGWIWVPGSEWAPAWVAWRNSPDYYGWAPLGPGINININIGIPASSWVFVRRHYFGSPYAYRYYEPRSRNVTIINNTTIINNVNVYNNQRYFSGPSRRDVQMATNRSIRPVRIFNSNEAGVTRVSNNQLNIYRPSVERLTTNHAPVERNSSETIPARNGSNPTRVFNQEAQNNNQRPSFQNGFPMDNTRPERSIQINPNQRVIERQPQQNISRPERTFNPTVQNTQQNQPVFDNRPVQPASERVMRSQDERYSPQHSQPAESRPTRTFSEQRIEVRRPEPRQVQRVENIRPTENNVRQAEERNDGGDERPSRRGRNW